MHNINRAFITITFWVAIFQVQAMEQPKTLTEVAQEQELITGQYISPRGLIYKGKKTVKKKERILHIKKHLVNDTSKRKHTFFNTGTEARDDIIGFIEELFRQFEINGIDIKSKDATKNLILGNITLHTKQYTVVLNYNSQNDQHIYEIVPSNSSDTSYPAIGITGGNKGDGSQLYGYRLNLTHTTDGPEIETLCLSEFKL